MKFKFKFSRAAIKSGKSAILEKPYRRVLNISCDFTSI